uniref:TRAP transporter substrate-binding protein n=1 Tax=Marinobacterium profundum TaxID=1714300 RepID=UPI00082F83E3|nr:TRAP transporter substrate-binding protein [Marinobacterium profundum]
MKLKITMMSALFTVVAFVFSGVASAKDLRLGLIVPGSHAWTVAAAAMGDELKARSGGNYSITTFPSGQLGSEARMLQQLQTGALDMAFMTTAEITNRIPDFGALYAPYLVRNVAQAGKLLNGRVAQGMLEKLPAEAGVVGLGYGIAGMRLMLNAFPADSAESINGRKMRITPFAPVLDFYQLLGAAATPMPLTDVYDALANGQVDGVDADMELVWKLKLYERGSTLVRSNHMMFPVVGLISGRLWSQLNEEDRALIAEVTKIHLNKLFEQYTDIEAQMLENVQGAGVKVVQAEPEFFGDSLDQWEAIWLKKAPVLADLRREAAGVQ